jgi:LPXTG-motif cell wall-anchored protein
MEEATELFTLMQGMIARANELARAAAYRSPVPPAPAGASPRPPTPVPATGGSSSDDLLLVGILAMGAGAGLLAALARRMGDPPPSAPSGSGRSTTSGSSR